MAEEDSRTRQGDGLRTRLQSTTDDNLPKRNKFLFALWTSFFAAGGAMLGIAGFMIAISSVTNPLVLWLGYLGVAVTVVGLVVFVLWVALRTPAVISEAITTEPEWARVFRYRTATKDDVDRVFEFIKSELGPDLSPAEQMKQWLDVNPDIFHLVERPVDRNSGEYEVVGFFELLPLRRKAATMIDAGSLTGAGLQKNHITKSFGKACATYIGSVVARGPRAKAYTLAKFEAALKNAIRRSKQKLVFTRPVTGDGFRLVSKYKFHHVQGQKPKFGEVCKTDWQSD